MIMNKFGMIVLAVSITFAMIVCVIAGVIIYKHNDKDRRSEGCASLVVLTMLWAIFCLLCRLLYYVIQVNV